MREESCIVRARIEDTELLAIDLWLNVFATASESGRQLRHDVERERAGE